MSIDLMPGVIFSGGRILAVFHPHRGDKFACLDSFQSTRKLHTTLSFPTSLNRKTNLVSLAMPLEFALSRVRRLQRFGRWLAALLAAAAVAAVLILAAGLLDAWLAFESPSRTVLFSVVLSLVSIAALSFVIFATRFSITHAAHAADRILGSPRNPATAALSLRVEKSTPLASLLVDRTREAAALEIAALPAARVIPWRGARRGVTALFIAFAPIAILAVIFPEASFTIARRLADPSADLPPWSKFRFAVEPSSPVVVYGGELALAVEISGDTPTDAVEFLIRRPGKSEIQRLPTFRESETRFSRTLDSITEPVSIAFAIGKARSEWHAVELLLQPKVMAGQTSVKPPAYTGREPITATLDTNEITALEGSEVTLSLTSNRPLAPSSLIFTPATAPGAEPVPEEIPGEITSVDSITFRWTATRPGTLSALLRDVRSTPAAEPLVLSFKAIIDQAPVVDLISPPRFLLATPSSVLKIDGRAEDDFALSKVRLVRTLEGFRDRARTVAPALTEKAFELADQLPLNLLGVSPGQVIELFVEAADHNPSLLGQGSSEISRIQIISEEDYAERIRAKTTLEQFNARYQAIAEALKNARESLEKMRDAKAPAESEKALEAAKRAHQQAAELLEQLASDFPAFELEKRLKQVAQNAAGDAKANLGQLGKFDPNAPAAEQKKQIDEMLERLGARQKEQQQLQKDAAMMAEAGKILEMAAKFQQIYQTQKSLSERIRTIAEEIHKGNDQNRRLLASLADTQEKNREALDEFAAELQKRAASTKNPALQEMVASTEEFLQALALSNPQSVMDLGAKSGRQGASEDAYVQAEMARAMLETLMSKPNPFAQACHGHCMKFTIPFPDVNQTMQQLLEALMCQNPGYNPGQGQGGGGMGAGGTGPTGNAAPGFSTPDIPVLGPQRMMFEPASLGGSTDGKGKTAGANPLTQAAESETLKPTEKPVETNIAPDPQSIPEPYREAVRKYFTP
jgi:hypothetical protein